MPDLPDSATLTREDTRISYLKQGLVDGDYVINTRYQRDRVGPTKEKFRTRLIESVIRGFPIPPLLAKQVGENT